jgi:REDY-like protein HapK
VKKLRSTKAAGFTKALPSYRLIGLPCPAISRGSWLMTMIVVLFNLKAGKSKSDYEAWAKTTDLPTVNSLKSVDSFKVFRASGLLGSNATSPYQYIETLEINDMDGLFADIAGPVMQKVAAQFQDFADSPIFIVTESLA